MIIQNRAILSPLVRLELIQAVRQNELTTFDYYLSGLDLAPIDSITFEIAETLLEKIKASRISVGLVDLVLAAQSIQQKCPVSSLDKVFARLQALDLIDVFPDMR
jgi:predicted nucleic acid-binding protein